MKLPSLIFWPSDFNMHFFMSRLIIIITSFDKQRLYSHLPTVIEGGLQGPKWLMTRVSIAVVFVIFAVEFMNTTANSTKMTTAINDNAQIFFCISCKLSHLEQKKNSKFFKKNFQK